LLTNRLNNGVHAPETGIAAATAMVTDRRMFHVHNDLARFSNYLGFFLASVYLLVSQKETNIWPFICATNKKNKYTNKKVVILYAYPCIGPKKSPFFLNKYTTDGCKGKKPLHRRKTVFCVFVYLCIGAKKSQP
jgi:hypothetical protein